MSHLRAAARAPGALLRLLGAAPVSRAVVGHAFTPRAGGGTGGPTCTGSSLLNVLGSVVLVDLGSVLSIRACTVPWQSSTCPGRTWPVLTDVAVRSARSVQRSDAPVAPGQALHLRATLTGTVANAILLDATPAPARTPGDRSAA